MNYCLITTTKGSKSVTTLEFSTDSNLTWITTEEKWYLNKDIMSQAVIKKIVETELEYVLVDKDGWPLDDEENADKSSQSDSFEEALQSNPSIVIGIGQYWEASRLYFKSISPSVDEVYAKHVYKMKKFYNKNKRTSIDFDYVNLKKQRIGYRFKNVSSCIIGYDPCNERSDEGYYDQYMFNIGNNYIFGGHQGYYDIEYIDHNDGDNEDNNYCSHIVKKL